MKLKYLIFCFSSICFSQNKHLGIYNDASGNKIELFENNKFRHTWQFDLSASWTTGKWSISNDTLKLEAVKVYDTLNVFDKKNNRYKDSLVLAEDEIPKRINETQNAIKSLSSGGQNRVLPNTLFFLKKNKLIIIKADGKLQTEKIKGFFGNKTYNTWYRKRDE
ncbi:hypothetical protein [Flavobacterium aquicola]|uniref:Uncharacterized protein n=1 Tax=Flavobacterium aquicola TaxID=1682742 RepID=A0A3E0DYU7_9FLAO|nr:hypothetical protein [Flavobacterium aquicola]REG91125.1 hypothetical protein C8P67_11718 [Flavobacterium aquicola]